VERRSPPTPPDRRTGPARRRLRLVGLGLVALGVAGACGSGSEAAPTTSSGPPPPPSTTTTVPEPDPPVGGLVATVEVSRLFSLQRQHALGLQNVGDQPVRVLAIALETPLFEPAPLTERELVLAPGGRELVMPVPYGAARCGPDPADTFEAVVLVEGTAAPLRMPAPEKHAGAIARLHARECAAVAVREAVDLRFADRWAQEGRSITGELELRQRTPGVEAAVDEVAGSVIFGVELDGGPPVLEVDDDDPTARVRMVVSADRCDPHALIESKKTFVFLAWVRLDGSEPIPVEVEPVGAARAALDDLLSTCLG
jgi:hypothetical protein